MSSCGICGHEGDGYEVFGFVPCCKKCFDRIMEREAEKNRESKNLENGKSESKIQYYNIPKGSDK